jgi:hypothetical protein
VDGCACHSDHPRGEVDLEVADGEALVSRSDRAAQHGSHPRHELVVHEGPHDVVVTAAREAPHAVDRVAACAHHDHGDVTVPAPSGFTRAQAAAELEAGRIGKHRVEEHEIRLHLLREVERGSTRVRGEHLEAVVGQLPLEVRAHGTLVLDQQDRSPHHASTLATAH